MLTPKRPEGSIAQCNELATSILAKKYYGPNDKSPSDVFWRVALVGAIPDVVDAILEDNRKRTLPSGDSTWQAVFSAFPSYLYRVLERRGIPFNLTSAWSSEEVARKWGILAEAYYEKMANLEFLPGSPTLINAGGPVGMLSSCFFLRVPDSMEGIFEKVKEVALISKAGGGVGLDFSELRPKGSPVGSMNGVSSGPISFMKVFNTTGDQVQQGGVRRAALMATLRVDHPDILDFITCKETEGDLANFNISVLVTDAFMEAVLQEEEIELYHESSPERKKIRARVIWDKLTEAAHRNGEPGIIFIDTIMKSDVLRGKYGKLNVNPCSEITLLPYESCNLASLNLSKCIVGGSMNFDKLGDLTRTCVRFLDNTIDLNNYVLPEISEATLLTRRIGVGVTGLADAFLKLGIRYGSDESLAVIDFWFSYILSYAQDESARIGGERGIPDTLCDIEDHKFYRKPRRNLALLSCQPTGTVSMIMNQVSSGIEPVFRWSYERTDSYGKHEIKHDILKEWGDEKSLPDYAKTSTEIPWKEHIAVQGAIQKHIDNSISKTIILPNSATVSDVSGAYFDAFRKGCKSTTVYRDGSRSVEVLSAKKKEEEPVLQEVKRLELEDRSRANVAFGCTFKIQTPSGEAYITVNEDMEGIREVLVNLSKSGSEVATYTATIGRLISNSLKYRVPLNSIIEHLIDQKSSPIYSGGKIIKSVPDAIAQVLLQYVRKYEGFSQFIDTEELESLPSRSSDVSGLSGNICPECGEVLYLEGGCEICKNCGHSRCG